MINLRKPEEPSEDGVEFYTVEPTGDSGTNQTGLAILCGVTQSTISQLEKTLISKSPSKTLQPFVGKDLTLISSDKEKITVNGKPVGNLKIYRPDFCFAAIQHYAFQGNEIAQHTSLKLGTDGFNLWVQRITGWKKPIQPSYIPYWYQRTRIAMSDTDKPIQSGYFCVYLEMMDFFQQLETRLGYLMPDINPETEEHLVPDISIAIRFNGWLRSDDKNAALDRLKFLGSEEKIDFRPERTNKDKVTKKKILMPPGSHDHEIVMYNHVYPKSSHGEFQIKEARSYPKKYLEIFFYYMEELWISEYFKEYLSQRSLEGWNQIESSIRALSTSQKESLKNTLIGRLFPLLPPA